MSAVMTPTGEKAHGGRIALQQDGAACGVERDLVVITRDRTGTIRKSGQQGPDAGPSAPSHRARRRARRKDVGVSASVWIQQLVQRHLGRDRVVGIHPRLLQYIGETVEFRGQIVCGTGDRLQPRPYESGRLAA
ncbi:MAG: hypothetical protein R3D56_00655 [Paracoccaceae bacterium]